MVRFDNVTIRTKDNKKIITSNFSGLINNLDLCLILGENGTGKSTFLKTILGLYKNFSGDIYIGTNKISYLPQSLDLDINFPITVKDLMKFGLYKENGIFGSIKNENIINKIAEDIGIQDILNKNINQISGGQLQKSLLGKILIENSELIILDEPFANIDQKSIDNFIHILVNIKKTIFIITHDAVDKVKSYADKIIVLPAEHKK